jgi:polyhydroxyalkanoate synthesis repressor PhaR
MSDASAPAPAAARTPRVIKRYANRKMYDTERSCYITLEEVAEMVRAGNDLRVIDNKTKDDLTEVTLTQALLNSERKKRGSVSIDSLKHLFAQGGELLQSRVTAPVERARTEAEKTVEKWRTEAEKTVGRVLSKKDGERDVAEGAATPGAGDQSSETVAGLKAPRVEIPTGLLGGSGGSDDSLKRTSPKFVENTQRAYDEWQGRIDDRVRLLVSALTAPAAAAPAQTSDDFARLLDRVAALEAKVEQLQAQIEEKGA